MKDLIALATVGLILIVLGLICWQVTVLILEEKEKGGKTDDSRRQDPERS